MLFCLEEKYFPEEVNFTMPPTSTVRLPYLTAEDLRTVLENCTVVRDKALIMFMVDTGIVNTVGFMIDINETEVSFDMTLQVHAG